MSRFGLLRASRSPLSPGEHSELIRSIIEESSPHALRQVVCWSMQATPATSGATSTLPCWPRSVSPWIHGKMPDVVLHYAAKNWLLLVESVTSHGPVDGKRHAEFASLFAGSTAGLVNMTAFPNRATMARYLGEIAWETEVWVADALHLIPSMASASLARTSLASQDDKMGDDRQHRQLTICNPSIQQFAFFHPLTCHPIIP